MECEKSLALSWQTNQLLPSVNFRPGLWVFV